MKITRTFSLLLLSSTLALGAAACSDPAKDKAQAQVGAPVEPAAAPVPAAAAPAAPAPEAAAPAATETLAFDGTTSKISFTGSKVTGKHDGGFKTFTGKVELAAKEVTKSTIGFEIDMASVFTDAAKLTGHLQTDDFFSVATYPKATFTSTAIVAGAEGAYTVTGNLELRGVKKSITFPAKVTITDGEVAATSEFALNRKLFGIVYPGMKDDLIRDDVVIKLDLHAPRGKTVNAKM